MKENCILIAGLVVIVIFFFGICYFFPSASNIFKLGHLG